MHLRQLDVLGFRGIHRLSIHFSAGYGVNR